MRPIQISAKNLADSGTLSGGSWRAALPLANLQNRFRGTVARSTNVLATSTMFDIDLGASPRIVKQMGFFAHNLSVVSTYRLTAGSTLGASDVYDSGTRDVWTSVYLPQDLEWEDDNFWTGTISAEDAEGYPFDLLHECSVNVRARYWRLQLTDTTNAAGYIEGGRFWLGPLWSPQRGYAFGAALQWEPRSEEERSLGGQLFFDERDPARIFTFQLETLNDVEALGTVIEIQRDRRNDREVLVIPDPDDLQRGFRRNLLARIRTTDPLMQDVGRWSAGFTMEELL